MSRICAAVVVAASALAAWPQLAAAESIPSREPLAGPVLAGARTLWATGRPGGGSDLMATRAGGAPASVAYFPPGTAGDPIPSLAASPSRVVVSYELPSPSVPRASRTVLTGPLDGPLEKLDEGCSSAVDVPRVVDASGSTIAFPRCGTEAQRVFVRDYATPAPVEQPVPAARPRGLRIAGRYLAWLDGPPTYPASASAIVVGDRVAGTEAYRLTPAAIGGQVHDLDIQDDGKVAFSFVSAGRMKVAWASPADPVPHVLPLPPRSSYEVRIAGDEIGYHGGMQADAGVITLAEVGVADLAGRVRRLGNQAEGGLFSDDFDFDGDRIAWWSYRCSDVVIRTAAVDGSDASAPPRAGCRLRFERTPRVSGTKSARLFVDCFGFAAGDCTARKVVLSTGPASRKTVVGRGDARRVLFNATGRRLLATRSRLRVRISALLTDSGGRRERRETKVTLRRGS